MRYRITKITIISPSNSLAHLPCDYIVDNMEELEKFRAAHKGDNKDIKVRFVYEEIE